MPNKDKLKQRTARLSVISNTLLIVMKLTAGLLSGSVSIISEAIHSALDLVAALIAFVAVRIADKPPDREHPYGHGKFENVSGVLESLLIFGAAIWIIVEAVHHLLEGSNFLSNSGMLWGVVVMLLSAVINFFISRRLYKVARQTHSVALEADALHLKTDIYTSLGVSLGLGLMYLTNWHVLDSLIAIGVAAFILYEAYKMLIKSFQPLIDTTIPIEELEQMKQDISRDAGPDFTCRELKSRMSGARQIVELTLSAPGAMRLEEADKKVEELKKRLGKKYPRAEWVVLLQARPQE